MTEKLQCAAYNIKSGSVNDTVNIFARGKCGNSAVTYGCGELAKALCSAVTRGKYAGDIGCTAFAGAYISVFVKVDNSLENIVLRHLTYGNKQAVYVKRSFCACFEVCYLNSVKDWRAVNVCYRRVKNKMYIFFFLCAFYDFVLCTKAVAAMNKIDFFCSNAVLPPPTTATRLPL